MCSDDKTRSKECLHFFTWQHMCWRRSESPTIDDFRTSCYKSFPEDQPIKDVKRRKITNSEKIDCISSDIPPGKRSGTFLSAGIFSTPKIVEVTQDPLFLEAPAMLVKSFGASWSDRRITQLERISMSGALLFDRYDWISRKEFRYWRYPTAQYWFTEQYKSKKPVKIRK